jgi:protein TonB
VPIKRVQPAIPARARAGGVIAVEGVITTTGAFRDLRVIRGAANPLAPYVLDALKQWKFRPATEDGRPVAVVYAISVDVDVR